MNGNGKVFFLIVPSPSHLKKYCAVIRTRRHWKKNFPKEENRKSHKKRGIIELPNKRENPFPFFSLFRLFGKMFLIPQKL